MLSPDVTHQDFARVPLLSMNMSGRFTGKEIRLYGQAVLKHMLQKKNIGLFFGQQINFKPSLPKHFESVGGNKAFLHYNRKIFRGCDEKQYRYFLRDLHQRGQMPHHYLPQGNYAITKIRYRMKPWTELVAISWVTDERQTRLKTLNNLRSLVAYAMRLSIAEEMPVIIGGSFRLSPDDVSREMDGDLSCFGYRPASGRRKMRMSNFYICSDPLKMDGVKPLVCAKLEVDSQLTTKWMNAEDAFYWDPVQADLLMPIETPHPSRIPSPSPSLASTSAMFPQRPYQPVPLSRPNNILLPTAPVTPTVHGRDSCPDSPNESPPNYSPQQTPPDSPTDFETCTPSTPGSHIESAPLSVITEVPAVFEHIESGLTKSRMSSSASNVSATSDHSVLGSSRSLTCAANGSAGSCMSTIDAEKEDQIFEILEAMMNDKTSTFYVKDDAQDGVNPLSANLPSVEGSKNRHPTEVSLSKSMPNITNTDVNITEQPDARCAKQGVSAWNIHTSDADTGDKAQIALPQPAVEVSVKPADSYRDLYDEDIINNSTQCYMS